MSLQTAFLSTYEPLYDIRKTFEENLLAGPPSLVIPERPPSQESVDFLGFQLASRIGIAAGPLIDSRWVQLCSSLGYDLLTFKTFRAIGWPCHPLPNVMRVREEDGKFVMGEGDDLTMANSMGNPSLPPDQILREVRLSKTYIKEKQLLVSSIYGAPRPGVTLLEDYLAAAKLAMEAGADVIEVNISCPNVPEKEGCLYLYPEIVYELTSLLSRFVHPIPLLLKVGYLPEREAIETLVRTAARGGARGISAINTLSRTVYDREGKFAFGETRKNAGVGGAYALNYATTFLRTARELIDREKLGLGLIGCGGVVEAHQFDALLDAGADLALTAGGAIWDPYLALRYHHARNC